MVHILAIPKELQAPSYWEPRSDPSVIVVGST
jgi:hypothetical protein